MECPDTKSRRAYSLRLFALIANRVAAFTVSVSSLSSIDAVVDISVFNTNSIFPFRVWEGQSKHQLTRVSEKTKTAVQARIVMRKLSFHFLPTK